MKYFIGAVLLFTVMALTSQAVAGQFWSDDKTTNGLIIASNVLLVVDWAQTRYGTDRPDQFEESGFAEHFTGTHPTTGEVNRYNATALVLLNTLGYFLPERATLWGMEWNPKKSLYFGATAVEGVTVYNNYEAGVKLDF
jgi:hypothetical protein